MTQELLENPIPEPIENLLTIFKENLEAVTFPDINAEILEGFAEQVRIKAKELQEAQARVLSIQEALDASKDELLQKSMRGLAYAKLYAEDREELLEKLSTISLSTRSTATRKKSSNKDNSIQKKSRMKKPTPAVVVSELPEPAEKTNGDSSE